MKEAFLAQIWKLRRYAAKDLRTTAGEAIQVLSPGMENTLAGPDFFNASVKIGDTTWVGNAEIHVLASDWLRHKHHTDPNYNNIILHIVYTADVPICRADGSPIPTLELKDKIAPQYFERYQLLTHTKPTFIPCQNYITQVDGITQMAWLDRLLVERLQLKTEPIIQQLQRTNNNWEAVFFRQLAIGLGGNANAQLMQQVADSIPFTAIAKHRKQLLQLEALLLGQAGFLNKEQVFEEDYPKALQREYRVLQSKFNLQALPAHVWKFGGLRPPNFPTLRLAQLAKLLYQHPQLFIACTQATSVKAANALTTVELEGFWQNHYLLHKSTPTKRKKSIGQAMRTGLIINTLVPMLFVYAQLRQKPMLQNKALQLLEELPPERNSIIKRFNQYGVPATNAAQTQALLQLYKYYCTPKQCLFCAIGNRIIYS